MSSLGNKETFSKNLRSYIEQSGKDRKELAQIWGFPYSTVTEWVNGKKYPRIDRIEVIADYFGILKSDLIEEKVSTLSKRLTEAMKMRNTTAGEIVSKTGIPANEISAYVNGEKEKIPPKDLYKVAKCLDVNEAWLSGRDAPLERMEGQKRLDKQVECLERFENDKEFRQLVIDLDRLNRSQFEIIKNTVKQFLGQI